MNAKMKKRLAAAGIRAGSGEAFLSLTAAERAKVRRRTALRPPAGYSSWLSYAVATMDDRSLDNDQDEGHQPQWPARVTRTQMRAAARAELALIERLWSEMERAWAGKIETTHSLADWAERALSKRETAEMSMNPKTMTAIKRHKAGRTKFGKISDIRDPKK